MKYPVSKPSIILIMLNLKRIVRANKNINKRRCNGIGNTTSLKEVLTINTKPIVIGCAIFGAVLGLLSSYDRLNNNNSQKLEFRVPFENKTVNFSFRYPPTIPTGDKFVYYLVNTASSTMLFGSYGYFLTRCPKTGIFLGILISCLIIAEIDQNYGIGR